MRHGLLALPVVCLLNLPAFADDGASAGSASITSPAAGTELPLTDGLAYQIGAVSGATQYECAVTQGNAKWKESVSPGSTGCSLDHRTLVAKKFKPGRATLSVRAKVNGKWTSHASVVVKLVTAPTPAPASPSARGGTSDGGGNASGGAETWDGTYIPAPGPRPTTPNVLRCPHYGSMVGSVDVSHGAVSFVVYLDPGEAAPDRMPPGARVDVTAALANGKISGTVPFKPETLAVLASPTAGYNGALAGQTGLTIGGAAVNDQGRKLKIAVTSGNASCSFEVGAR